MNFRLKDRPLEPGRGRIYRPPFMTRMLYAEYLSRDMSARYEVPVFSLSEAFEVIDQKAKEDRRGSTV